MNHAWVRGVPGRFDPIPVGAPMRGGIAGRVVASEHPDFPVGTAVTGYLDWADYNVSSGRDHLDAPLQIVPPDLSLESCLGALRMTGVCAFLGLSDFARPLPGDTLVVSGASGGIGTIAVQIGRLLGARVVATARGAEKCAVVQALGADVAIDQTVKGWETTLTEACPEGIDVFFDNVGGTVLDAALVNVARGGRVVVCGATAHYDGGAAIHHHAMVAVRGCTMVGFFYFDQVYRWPAARRRLVNWVREGRIREVFDIAEGFDAVPAAAVGQFARDKPGRKLVRISDEPNGP